MRRSVALLLALVLALPVALAAPGVAVAEAPVLAQDTGEESDTGDTESEETTGSDEDAEGQDDPATESGVDEGQEGEAAVEEGPVWTYQMAWISIGLLVLMGLAMARAYHHFVAQRRKSGI